MAEASTLSPNNPSPSPRVPAVVTIVSNNYLHYARTLMESVAKQHPEARRYCVIVDTDPGPAAELAAEFEAIPLSALGLPFGDEFMFQYTILELNTAVKPWALQLLLERGHSEVLYIDPDIYLYRPMTEVFDLLRQGASIVLTPHLLAPVTDGGHPGELDIRVCGTYNLGFCAIGDQPTTREFLKWWQGKLARDRVVDQAGGMFVDQSWIDLVPGLFENVAVLRHPGYNVAYWNLAQRAVVRAGDGWQVNGRPLVFFHYSGIDTQNPHPLSKYQSRYTLDTVAPAVRELVLQYCRTVIGNGTSKYRDIPYGYGRYTDGKPITAGTRTRFRTSAEVRRAMGANPFVRKPGTDETEEGLSAGAARLRAIYQYFLGRSPDPSALHSFSRKCGSSLGHWRVALGVGLSPESRRQPGWKMRLALWPLLRSQTAVALAPSAAVPASVAYEGAAAVVAKFPSLTPAQLQAPGINLIGYIAAELGIGEAARSLARACTSVGIPYSVTDVGYQTSNLQRDTQALANAVDKRFAIDLVYVNADQTPGTLDYLKKQDLEGKFKIGFWHWEQPKLPPEHLASFAHLNEVWVPSAFVRDAVAALSPVPVVIVPHALSFAPTPGVKRADFNLPEHKLLALVMYDFHSYQHRKNPQAAIAAFRRATVGRDDAALVVKTINGQHHPEAVAELRAHLSDLPGTVMIEEFLTRQQVWDLQSLCDMLVSLHRAEGFGLAPAEMMYLGKPVVATGWSANMDFMTAENSMPVRYTLEPLKETIGAYKAGPLWAEADVDHAASCIRRLLDEPALRERIGKQAAIDIARQLSPQAVGERVKERLQALAFWHPHLRVEAAASTHSVTTS
jgi:glycosyltransferase involved in cell wall biosynthesis